MRYAIRIGVSVASIAILGSCSGVNMLTDAASPQMTTSVQDGVSDTPVQIGAPFDIAGTTYSPIDTGSYDDVGYAGIYGPEMAGKPTANGERLLLDGVTGAHKTLPIPSYIEVTALDTGKTILVRVNDRGPLANDRLIELSEGAARQLGIAGGEITGVRVRRVNPPEQERAVLRSGLRAAERIETPETLLKVLRDKLAKLPRPSTAMAVATAAMKSPAEPNAPANAVPAALGEPGDRFVREGAATVSRAGPKPSAGGPERSTANNYVVQVAAFSSRGRAETLARKLGANVVPTADGRLFRVRYGPYAAENEAARRLETAKARGYPQARVYRD